MSTGKRRGRRGRSGNGRRSGRGPHRPGRGETRTCYSFRGGGLDVQGPPEGARGCRRCSSKRVPTSSSCAPSCAGTTPTCSPTRCGPGWQGAGRAETPGARWSGGSARTAGSASAGRPSSAGRAGRRPISSSSSTRRGAPGLPFPSSRSTRWVRPSCASARRSRNRSSSRRSSRASSTSPSATPSPRRGPTWPRCGPGPSATATSTSSTGPRSSPPERTWPTTCGWR